MKNAGTNYWVIKSEPDCYSVDDFQKDGVTLWSGVRNYQARNFMRDEMKPGDLCFFYHSNAEPTGIAGVAQVVRSGVVDQTQFDKKDEHYDPKSKPENPLWVCAEVKFFKKYSAVVSLKELKTLQAKGLLSADMPLLQRGQRLSVMPISEKDFKYIDTLKK